MTALSWMLGDGAVRPLHFVDPETNELAPANYGVVELAHVGHFPFYFPSNGIILLDEGKITGYVSDAIATCRWHIGSTRKLEVRYEDWVFSEFVIEWATHHDLSYVACEVNGFATAFVCQGSWWSRLPAGQRTQPVEIAGLEAAKSLCEWDVARRIAGGSLEE